MHKPWFKELGYTYNPFTIKPGFFDDEIVGYDKVIEQLVAKVNEHDMCFLEGGYGQGKTTAIQYLVNEFQGKNRVVHISRNRSDRAFNYDELLKKASGIKGWFGGRSKDVILLVDETAKINESDCQQIMDLYDAGYFQSVIFIDKSLKESNLSDEVKKEIGKNVFVLGSITPKDAVEIVRSRLDDNEGFVTDKLIEEVFAKSKKNTRTFLANMEDVSRNAIENGRQIITKDDVAII